MTILWGWSQSFQISLRNLIAPLLSHVIRQSFTTTYKWLAMWFIKEFHIKISQLVFNIIIFVCIIYNFLSLIISAYSVWVLSAYTLNIHPEFTRIYNNLLNNFTKTLLLATSICVAIVTMTMWNCTLEDTAHEVLQQTGEGIYKHFQKKLYIP